MPNASLQLLPEAAAQRRLEAVSCKALLGSGTGRDPALAWAFVPFLLCLVGLSLPPCRTIECLPQTLNRICIKCRIGTHNRQLFHHSLGNDQPIKRITMMQRQCRYRDKMGDSN